MATQARHVVEGQQRDGRHGTETGKRQTRPFVRGGSRFRVGRSFAVHRLSI